jgi:hypothetical protein
LLSTVPFWLAQSCLDRPIGALDPVTTNVFTAAVSQDGIQRIDLLFMIDNSASMSDKQLILETAVPDLVDRLVNPVCIDEGGRQHPAAAPGERCPAGQRREFRAVTDINVGVISSSLGDAGADNACVTGDTVDGARLLGSLSRASRARSNEWGFITWREGTDPNGFKRDFQTMVRAVGESGCGWEASLEAWYRFLVDPVPYAILDKGPCAPGSLASCTAPRLGSDQKPLLDDTLLQQRAAFLRPDSLVAIIMLTDENDCSMRATGQSWLMGSNGAPMYAASSACADDPSSACCYSCPSGPPAGCEWADGPCQLASNHLENRLPTSADGINLRCFDQKRRFGVDFLYPTQRYVNALTQLRLCPSNPSLAIENCQSEPIDNPLFAQGRAPGSVYLAGIVGVPWQAIAADRDGAGAALADDVLRFKTAQELDRTDWDAILGEPAASPPRAPGNPLMRESTTPRPGVVIGGPNGREYATDAALAGTAQDLEYACIFPLPKERDCAGKDPQLCDCAEGFENQPLCEQTAGASPTTTQYWAKAYPGLRELEVLRGFGKNSIVASICARNVSNLERRDFGYRPAIASILERLEEQLARHCLPRPLEVAADGSVPCTLVEVLPGAAAACACDPTRSRSKPSTLVDQNVRRQLAAATGKPCGVDDPECRQACLCEVEQIVNEPALSACRNEETPTAAEGWCYVADSDEQHIGNPALVAECRPTERRLLRLVGEGNQKGALTVISCSGRSFDVRGVE